MSLHVLKPPDHVQLGFVISDVMKRRGVTAKWTRILVDTCGTRRFH